MTTTPELTEAQIDALFAHMQELVEQLPQMEELSQQLRVLIAADHVVRFDRAAKNWEMMLSYVDAQIEDAQARLAQAEAAGADQQLIDDIKREILAHGQTRGLRVGPLQKARADLERGLRDGGFATPEEATAIVRPREELIEMSSRLTAFQQDYAATLAACQQAEGIDGQEPDAAQPAAE